MESRLAAVAGLISIGVSSGGDPAHTMGCVRVSARPCSWRADSSGHNDTKPKFPSDAIRVLAGVITVFSELCSDVCP